MLNMGKDLWLFASHCFLRCFLGFSDNFFLKTLVCLSLSVTPVTHSHYHPSKLVHLSNPSIIMFYCHSLPTPLDCQCKSRRFAKFSFSDSPLGNTDQTNSLRLFVCEKFANSLRDRKVPPQGVQDVWLIRFVSLWGVVLNKRTPRSPLQAPQKLGPALYTVFFFENVVHLFSLDLS